MTKEEIIERNTTAVYGSGNAEDSIDIEQCMQEYADQETASLQQELTDLKAENKELLHNLTITEVAYERYQAEKSALIGAICKKDDLIVRLESENSMLVDRVNEGNDTELLEALQLIKACYTDDQLSEQHLKVMDSAIKKALGE